MNIWKSNFNFLKSFVLTLLMGAICVQIEGASVFIREAKAGIAFPTYSYGIKTATQIPIVFSHDGSLLAVIEQNGAINLREASTGQILWSQFDSQNDTIEGLTISKDGKTLASFGKNAITLWDASTGMEHGSISLAEISGDLRSIEFSPDGKNLAGVDFEHGLYLWNIDTGFAKALSINQYHLENVPLFSPDGRFLISVNKGAQPKVKLWNRTTGRLHLEISSESEIVDAAFSPDAKVLATVAKDGQIKLWELVSGALKNTLNAQDKPSIIRFSGDGKYIASAANSDESSISLWNALTGHLVFNNLTEGGVAVDDLIFSQDGLFLATAGRDYRISLWSLPDGNFSRTLTGLSGGIVKTAFNAKQSLLSAVTKEGQLSIWDLSTGIEKQSVQLALANNVLTGFQSTATNASVPDISSQTVTPRVSNVQPVSNPSFAAVDKQSIAGDRKEFRKKKRNPHKWKGVRAVALSQNGLEMGVASEDGSLRIFKKHGNQRWNVSGHHRRAIVGLAFREKTKEWVTAGLDTEIKLWNDATGNNIKTFYGPEHPPRALAVSPDGQFIAVAGEDTRVFIFDAAHGKLKTIFTGHSDFVNALAFSPDGSILVSAGAEDRILLWDMKTGKIGRTLQGHSDEVNALAFNPNGTVLASASADSNVILWNLNEAGQKTTLSGHQGAVRTVAFNPRGNKLISGGEDGRVLVWDAKSGKLKKQIGNQTSAVNALVFDPAEKLHIANENSEISELDTDSGSELETITVPAGSGSVSLNDEGAHSNNLQLSVNINTTQHVSEKNADSFFLTLFAKALEWAVPSAEAALPDPNEGPGGSILVITSGSPTFGKYYAEILRTEGLNEFAVADIAAVTAPTLTNYDVVLLADMTLSAAQVSMLSVWVNNGGNLIAMHPDKQLANLLGLTDTSEAPLNNGYLLVDTSVTPGNGIVGETMQFHGVADRYTITPGSGAASIAMLYTNTTTATANPAISLRTVGTSGGQAAAFTYDLAKSVVYTRQGNPAWATQERDGFSPIRPDDKFFGNAVTDPQSDWVNLDKVIIPQADEQQRLLANLILEMNRDKKPLPRFWYFPRDLKAVVIMTGDDHGNGGTLGRFNSFSAASQPGCSVQNWECIRGTSYVYPGTSLASETQTTLQNALAFNNQGFEVGLHINTDCADYTQTQLENFYTQQITAFAGNFPGITLETQRHHCIAWSDWANSAKVQLANGMRLDTSYYYWPPSWILNRPGYFSGSGMPMRFADLDGSFVDVYQVATQLTDESGQSYPLHIDTLLNKALGAEGYFGAVTVNAHTDLGTIPESTAVVSSAVARGVPIITSRQMLNWLDFRNSSFFSAMSWSTNTLSFSVTQGAASTTVPQNGLQILLPYTSIGGILVNLKVNNVDTSFTIKTIKGVVYATFTGVPGNYVATYGADTTAPTVASNSPLAGATGVNLSSSVSATFSEPINAETINPSTFELRDSSENLVPAVISYNADINTALLTPNSPLAVSTTYSVKAKGGSNGVKDLYGNPLASDYIWSFTSGVDPCSSSGCSAWSNTTDPGVLPANDSNSVELGVTFRSDINGWITGIRFHQATVGAAFQASLWDASSQQQLATGTVTSISPGWQQLNFVTPVQINAGTIYVASYHAPTGNYTASNGFFAANGVDNGPIHLLRDGENGGNGLYGYNSAAIFPSNTFSSSNYWVDVVFTTNIGPDLIPPLVSGHTPAANGTGINPNTSISVTFNESMTAESIVPSGSTTSPSFELRGPAPSTSLVASSVVYNQGSRTATLTSNSPLAESSSYTVTVKGGTTGPTVKDAAGNALANDFVWSFSTGAISTSSCSGATESIWPGNPTPTILSDSDSSSVELGVKFRSSIDGYICGVRFYKGSANTGTHIGKLWDSAGNLIASAIFENETPSGWQSVNFDAPVQIQAGLTYVASYLAPTGRYSADSNYFNSGVTNGSLYAFSSGESAGNGVYQYGSGGFPANNFQATNYWVDIVFTSNIGPDVTPPAVISTQPAANASGVIPASPIKVTFNEAMNSTTIDGTSNLELRDSSSNLVPAIIGYSALDRSASITPANPLAFNTVYTAKVIGGVNGVKDISGNALVSDYTWSFTTGVDPCLPGGNPIVCENTKTGTPSTTWDIVGAGSSTIQGYATDISVNRGQTVRFKIDTPATDYRLEIYRMGYYNGNGARLIATVQPSAGLPQTQPACINEIATGLIDCGNWAESASWPVPNDAVSGVYFAKAVREDGTSTGLASHIFFIVRDDSSHSDILFQTADTTWQAYNNYGGNSFYTGSPAGRAYKVSYNRPFSTRNVDNGQDWVFNAEYPMIRWLEANGYNVSYFTGVDSDRLGGLITNHKVFLSVGHDEYWSGQQRSNVQSARDSATNPVNLVFLSGNEVFWKTRWENNITSAGGNLGVESYRTLVCYKETHAGAKIDPQSNVWTGTWRDPRFSPPADGGFPENELTGTLFTVNDGATTSIQVPAADGKLRFWRNTAAANQPLGSTITLPFGTLGYEWDEDIDNGFRPAGLIRMSTTIVPDAPVLTDFGSNFGSGTAVHSLNMYLAESGAKVFGAGTVQWSWGLDSNHDRAGTQTNSAMQQATVNLFADMNVQPATLQAGLITAAASTDNVLPSSVISSPVAGVSIAPSTSVNVAGSAIDAGGQVAGVEVSINGGAWHPAVGRENWSYIFTAPSTNGTLTIRTRAIDDSLNKETPGSGVTVNVGTGNDTTAPTIPQNLSAIVINGTQVNLNWDDSSDNTAVTVYQVERCAGTGCTTFLPLSTPVISAYNDIGLTEGTVYRYRVSAGDAAGNFSGYSSILTITPDVTPPLAPASLSANVASATQINLSWAASTDNVGVTGYQIERCAGASCVNFGFLASVSNTSFSDTGLVSATTYRYQVRAVDAAGNFSGYSTAISATTLDNIPPATPTGVTTSVFSSTQINLSWNLSSDNVGVTGYQIERCQGASCINFSFLTSVAATSFANTGLLPATTYQYRLRAIDAAGNLSGYSSIVSATTQAAPIVSTGYLSPTANVPITTSSGDNNGFQTSPTSAYANDGIFAVDTNSGTTTSSSCTSTGKDRHIYRDFGFAIPSSAAIRGIQIRLDARVDSQGSVFFPNAPKMCVQLSWDGGVNWVTAINTSTLTTTEATYTLGSTTNTWGRTWSATQLTNANFRVRIANVASGLSGANDRDFYLDWVAVQITYQ